MGWARDSTPPLRPGSTLVAAPAESLLQPWGFPSILAPPRVTHRPDHDPAALVDTLLPAHGKGASALVAGATARRRVALLSEARAALRARSPRWLVVHLPARTRGARFDDALAAAVDDALHAAGAPEALHDETSPAALVGSWLYRARATGDEGLVIVLDELDAWLDGRASVSAAASVVALLAQCHRVPLSLLASVRASSAAGAPALPAEVLAAFEHTVSVGPIVATVTRDPTGLTAVLAGRSFHRAGVLSAVESWLALPPPSPDHDVDDLAIVFTSPLASPVLPLPADLVLDWGEPRPVGSVPPPAPSKSPVGPAEVTLWAEGLRAAITLGESVRRVYAAPVTSVAEAEHCFRDVVARLPLAADAAARVGEATGASTAQLQAAARDALARFDRALAPLCAAVADGAPARRIDDLGDALTEHAARIGARSTAFVWLPGLRADLWRRFVERVIPRVPGLRPAGEMNLAWSLGEHELAAEAQVIDTYAAALRDGLSLAAIERAESTLPEALCAVAGGFAGRTAVLVAADGTSARTAFDTLVPWGLFTFEPFGGS
jgi:hypothetical protein